MKKSLLFVMLCMLAFMPALAQMGGDYNPVNPPNPEKPKLTHRLTLKVNPSVGGSCNFDTVWVKEDEYIYLDLHVYNNYTFKGWICDGDTLSRQTQFGIIMPTHNMDIVAELEYNPANPPNPNKNHWDKVAKEIIVDDFTPGELVNTIKSTITSAFGLNDVLSIVVGGKMNANDFWLGGSYGCNNCTSLDLSRVTDVQEMPSLSNTNLEKVFLPKGIRKIGDNAFAKCKKLAYLTLNCNTPPILGSNVFGDLSNALVVFVPYDAVDTYQNDETWGNFVIMPIQDNMQSITVDMPKNVDVKDFRAMWLELTNSESGQQMHYVITDRNQYTFPNIARNTTWKAVLRNEAGDVFGKLDKVDVKDKDLNVSFSSIQRPQKVSLCVHTPEGKDVTSKVQVTWTDSVGRYITQGTLLKGKPAGCKLSYAIVLDKELSMIYSTPSIKAYVVREASNNLICKLIPIKNVKMTGRMLDAETKMPISGGLVSVSQTFNNKYSNVYNIKSDDYGRFSIELKAVPTSLTFTNNNYVSQTLACDSLMNGSADATLSDVLLKTIKGATVSIGFKYTDVVGESRKWYDDFQNIDYELYNVTKNRAIEKFHVQFPQIVVMEDVDDGDKLRIVAKSRTNSFNASECIASFKQQKAMATFAITELGRISASFVETDNASVVGLLYNSKGKLLNTYAFSGKGQLTIADLADGTYTLVAMGSSEFFNSVYRLEELPRTGLVKDVDYIQHTVKVKSGSISVIDMLTVPKLNESKLYYTGENTSFTVNNPNIVAGNYLTMTGHIDFKPEYAGRVSSVRLIAEIPESCQFVDNSVMVGTSVYNGCTVNNNQVSISLSDYSSRVRFCVIPTANGNYTPNAFVQFDLDGKTIKQPIGSARYSVKDLSITVPSMTASKTITVSGTAIGTSTVEVYDNDVLVGQARSYANRTWTTTCNLNDAYNMSRHNIYAKVMTSKGVQLVSEKATCLYNKDYSVPEKVTMDYCGKQIIFDLINQRTTGYYSFAPSRPTFTFRVEFANKNNKFKTSNVLLYVFTRDKKYVKLEPLYDDVNKCWVASHDFHTLNLPVNVSVEYNSEFDMDFDSAHASKYISELSEAEKLQNESDSVYYSWLDKLGNAIDNNLSDESLREIVDTITSKDNKELTSGELVILNRFIKEITDNKYDGDDIFEDYEAPESDDYKRIKKLIPPAYGTVEKQKAGNCYTPTYNYNKKQAPTGNLSEDIPGGLWAVNEDADNPNRMFFVNQTNGDKLTVDAENQIGDIGNGTTDDLQRAFGRIETMCNAYLQTIRTDGISFDIIERLCKERIDDLKTTNRLYTNALDKIVNNKKNVTASDKQTIKKVLKEVIKIENEIGKASRTQIIAKAGGHITNAIGAFQLGAHIGESISTSWKWDMLIEQIKKNCNEDDKTAFIKEATEHRGWINRRNIGNGAGQTFCVGAGLVGSETLVLPLVSFGVSCGLDFWKSNYTRTDEQNYNNLKAKIKKSDKCNDYDNDNPRYPEIPDAKFGIDPSGYVYEGVPSNRLEGVKATCYYKEFVEDMYGDMHENIVKWDASEFEQENPVLTDKEGMYAWDVPQGLWQVKFEKEGYETAYSEWLPVPPPQLDVNIAMVQNRQPEVKEVHAFKDGVEISFDKYMLPAYLTTSNIKVSQGGKYVEGKIVLVDEEISGNGSDAKYASTVRFVPNAEFAGNTKVSLMVNNRVKSYADIPMAETFTQDFDIEKEVKSLSVDSLIKVPYQKTKIITVSAKPSDAVVGKVMHAESSSEMLATVVQKDITIDRNGNATFEIRGGLPGTAGITFTIAGTKIAANSVINIEQEVVQPLVSKPTASLESGASVYGGTRVELSASDKGYKIWYTTDGTCPCDENGSRKLYSAAIAINSDMTIKAITENADGEASEVATFVYSILQSTDGVSLSKGWNWVSFNMEMEAQPNSNTMLASGQWTSNNIIKNQQYFDMYSSETRKWIGTLSKHECLNNTQMYKIHSSQAQHLGLSGKATNPADVKITVDDGWNYIGYTPLVDMDITEALKNYMAHDGDVIKSQDAFAVYNTRNGWEGDLMSLATGHGYMLKRSLGAGKTSFCYPSDVGGASAKVNTVGAKCHPYAENMNIVGEISDIDIQEGDSVVALVNGELRGVGMVDEHQKVYLTIHGDEDANVILALQRDGNIIATANEMVGYQSNSIIGTPDSPTAIRFSSTTDNEDFVGTVRSIYSATGIKMNTTEKEQLPIGIYIIYSESNGKTSVTKYIRK